MSFINWLGFGKPRDAPALPDVVDNVRDSGTVFVFGRANSGEQVNEKSAMQIATVYACVRLLAESVGQLPLHLYRITGDDGQEKAKDHPLYKILYREPNPEMTSFSFWEAVMTHLLLWGNAYAQVVNWCPLYGYERVNGVPFTIVEHEAAVVRRIFESYVNGLTTHEIRNQLNEEGIPSPSGSLWGDSALASLLTNERYTGVVLTSKFFTDNHLNHKMRKNRGEVEQFRITDHHAPVVSEELFADAQFVRQMRRENSYPYGNYLVCPFCGERLVRQQSGWGCTCERFYIPKDKLKKAVIGAYAELDPEGIEDEMVRELKDAYRECVEIGSRFRT